MQRSSNPTSFFWYLSRHPEFQKAVSACYEEFFSDYMQVILDEKIDEYVSEIDTAKEMDLIRWKEIYGEDVDYKYEVQRIRDFLSARKPFLDEVWIEKKEVCTVRFLTEEGYIRSYMGVKKGERLERMPREKAGTVNGEWVFDGWFTQDGVFFDGTEPIEEDITLYARSHKVSEAN